MQFQISMTFGAHTYPKISFLEAVKIVENYTRIEHKHCDNFVKKVNADHWITSFWSEVLGGAKPPSYNEWITPITSLKSARSAHRARRMDRAISHLRQGIKDYNAVHTKWIQYRDGIHRGGKKAIEIIDITIKVLSVAGGTYAGTVVRGAALAGGIKAYTGLASGVGKQAQGIEKTIDYEKIIRESLEAFVTSLAGGALAKKFLGILIPRFTSTFKIDPGLAKEMAKRGLLPANIAQKALANFLSGAGVNTLLNSVKAAYKITKGKKMPMEQFLLIVCDEFIKQVGEQGWQEMLKAALAKY